MAVEKVTDIRATGNIVQGHLFGFLAHGYQPPREFAVDVDFAGKPHRAGFSVVPWVNDKITEQCYEPVLGDVEKLPPGLITSIYAPLRSYLKRSNPELFKRMQEAVANTQDKEYAVLGDPLVHIILPFLPPEDQAMLLEVGKMAFKNDFGFEPKGLWLPETAVSQEVLKSAQQAGYEFVPLRDSQVEHVPEGVALDENHNVVFVQVDGGDIALLLGNSGLSGYVSYEPSSTYNADDYMAARQRYDQPNGWNPLVMTDLERWGHHQAGADQFLKRALEIQQEHGFTPLNMKEILESFVAGREKTYVDVKENSSWSCEHELGRWTGECCCDNPSPEGRQAKRDLYQGLISVNLQVNSALDIASPGWRAEYTTMFAALSDDIFTGVNFGPALYEQVKLNGGNEEKARLYLAKTEVMVGLTSCGWFFGGDDRHERDIPTSMMQGVNELLTQI